jgi:hypothetical protein
MTADRVIETIGISEAAVGQGRVKEPQRFICLDRQRPARHRASQFTESTESTESLRDLRTRVQVVQHVTRRYHGVER